MDMEVKEGAATWMDDEHYVKLCLDMEKQTIL